MSTTGITFGEDIGNKKPIDLEMVCTITNPDNLTLALQGLTHYEALNTHLRATQDELKETYKRLAKRYHPDSVRDKAEKWRREMIIARIIEAYSILSNAISRENYDRLISRRLGLRNENDPEVREEKRKQSSARRNQVLALLQKGRYYNKLNDPWNAICHLKNALRMEPSSAEVHCEMGIAKSKNIKWKREAEVHLRKAVQLDPWKAQFYVVLGDFYRDQGLNVRAGKEYKRALWLDPQSADAAARLDDLLVGQGSKSALGSLKKLLFNGKKKKAAIAARKPA
ncbi:DnaJ domain-containing protein [Acidobacteriota bacterium]